MSDDSNKSKCTITERVWRYFKLELIERKMQANGRNRFRLTAPQALAICAACALLWGLSGCSLPPHSQSLRHVMQQEIGLTLEDLPAYRCTLGAHRGDSVSYLENTLLALQAAESDPRYAFIEFDVQYSQDKQIVVFHDSRLYRLFDHFDSISKLSYTEISELADGKIPRYRDVIGLLSKRLNIEIKSQGDDAEDAHLADELIADLKAREQLDQVMISSISDPVIRYINTVYPDVPTGQIFWITSSTFLHFDRLTERLYQKINETEADYLMLHVENFRNIETLFRLKPEGKTIMFWDFEDSMYLVHTTRNDRLWGSSTLGNLWDSVRFQLSSSDEL
jgi:glycerophosphoryl diester phosphodiesterase